jgi:hypothetical protein
MNIRDLKAGDRVYMTINKLFAPVEKLRGKNLIYETVAAWTSGPRKSFTQCKGTVMRHVELDGFPALEVQFISLIDPSNTGMAQISYHTLVSLWLYEGETNIDTVVPKKISDERNEWPYTAYQLPPVNIYRKKIKLVW